jgi:hypothetical protein
MRAQVASSRASLPSPRAMASSSSIRGARWYSAVWPLRIAAQARAQAR